MKKFTEVIRIWTEKKIAIFDIDVVGGANIKSMFPNETLSIFVMPPSIDILYRRLIERGDVNKQEIDVRIKKAESELDYASKFDNIIINNDLEESKKIAHTLIKEFIDE
jgi:guanylate kinase